MEEAYGLFSGAAWEVCGGQACKRCHQLLAHTGLHSLGCHPHNSIREQMQPDADLCCRTLQQRDENEPDYKVRMDVPLWCLQLTWALAWNFVPEKIHRSPQDYQKSHTDPQ